MFICGSLGSQETRRAVIHACLATVQRNQVKTYRSAQADQFNDNPPSPGNKPQIIRRGLPVAYKCFLAEREIFNSEGRLYSKHEGSWANHPVSGSIETALMIALLPSHNLLKHTLRAPRRPRHCPFTALKELQCSTADL